MFLGFVTLKWTMRIDRTVVLISGPGPGGARRQSIACFLFRVHRVTRGAARGPSGLRKRRSLIRCDDAVDDDAIYELIYSGIVFWIKGDVEIHEKPLRIL